MALVKKDGGYLLMAKKERRTDRPYESGALYRNLKKHPIIGKAFAVFYTAFTIFPLYFVAINSFKSTRNIIRNPFIITPEMFTVEAISRSFRLLDYPRTFVNNVTMLVISAALLVVFASLAGFAISTTRGRLLKGYYLMQIAVMTLPFTIAMVPLSSLMRTLNLNNNHFGTSLVYAACTLPFGIFLYVGHMKTIPKELKESAELDGCSPLKTYAFIYVPLLKAVTGTVIILRAVFFWNDFLIAFVTISIPPLLPFTVKLYSFASTRLTSFDLLFAGTLLVSIPIVIVFLSAQKYFINATAGAIKG
jgi:raffinose/stachyose/melibiose transport system permease protein